MMRPNAVKKHGILLLTALAVLLVISSFAVTAEPVTGPGTELSTPALAKGSCNPGACPDGYRDDGVACDKGICTRTCVTGECSDTFTTVYTSSVNMDDKDIRNLGYDSEEIDFGKFTPTDTSKCYKFRQTTPSGFIDNSDIDDYEDEHDFDSAIALYWVSRDKWYDNQNYYCNGEEGVLPPTNGAVWVDSDGDNGDDFDSADNLHNTNYLHCAPNQKACDSFDGHCDTDCYGHSTQLIMDLNANVENGFDSNNFHDFCTAGSGNDGGDPVIDDVNFDDVIVYTYVDEYDLVNKENDNQQCEYWPECNPADPCCTPEGYFRSSGSVCRSAHNVQCLTANSVGCGGVAYEDRCTGTSSECPDNNFEIDFDEACNGVSCVEQSCSGWTLQPQRTCNVGACQQQVPYACQNNLNCLNSSSCKVSASSQEDCRDGTVYDPIVKACYVNTGQREYNLTYDKNGNLASGLGLDYTYNSFNQLVTVRDNATGQIKEEYTYDHNGDRRKKVTYNSDGTATTVYYVSGNFIQTVNSSGVYNETYYYFNGKLVGKKDSDKSMLFFHPDHLGSTRLITDSASNVVADLSYKPFGELIDDAKERFLYTGKELDSSGNYYLGARYLDPAPLYTFTQPDQNIPDIFNPQDLNRYTYARNNPYTYTDPNGESPTVVTALAGAGIGALVGGGINLAVQLYNNGLHISQVDVSQILIASAAGAVVGGITGASLGFLGAEAIAAVGPEVFLGTTGAASGVGAQATVNLMTGQEVTANLDTAGYHGYIGGLVGGASYIVTNNVAWQVFRWRSLNAYKTNKGGDGIKSVYHSKGNYYDIYNDGIITVDRYPEHSGKLTHPSNIHIDVWKDHTYKIGVEKIGADNTKLKDLYPLFEPPGR